MTTRTRIFLLLTATTVALFLLVVSGTANGAAPFSFTMNGNPTGTGVHGPPGSTLVLATSTVDPALVGRSCAVTVDVANNQSVRQGTDILITSGGATLIDANVEALGGNAPPALLGNLVLGSTVTGSVRFGVEGAASLQARVTIACPEPPTTTVPLTTTPPPPVTVPPTAPVVVRPPADVIVVPARFTG